MPVPGPSPAHGSSDDHEQATGGTGLCKQYRPPMTAPEECRRVSAAALDTVVGWLELTMAQHRHVSLGPAPISKVTIFWAGLATACTD